MICQCCGKNSPELTLMGFGEWFCKVCESENDCGCEDFYTCPKHESPEDY